MHFFIRSFAIFITGVSVATAAEPLTLSALAREVRAHNPELKAARAQWAAQKERIPQAAAWDDPRLSFNEELARFVDVPRNGFTDQSLALEQTIPLSGKNRVRARAEVAAAAAVFAQTRRVELDVLAQARAAWFRLANAQAQLSLNEKNQRSLREIAEVGGNRYAVGEQNAAEVLQAQTATSELAETARDLDLERATAQSALNVVLDRDAFADTRIEASQLPSLPPLEKLRTQTLSKRPEVQQAAARLVQAQAGRHLASRAWIPDPALTLQVQRYNGAAQGVSELGAGISFALPWANPGKYAAGVREAQAALEAAQQDLRRAKSEALGHLRLAWEKVRAQQHHLDLFEQEILPQARQTFASSQLAYQNGHGAFTPWITAQRTLRDAEAEQRNNQRDYEIALTELEAATGIALFPNSTP